MLNKVQASDQKMTNLSPIALLIFSVFQLCISQSSPWSGNMHPSINFRANCHLNVTDDCAPHYSDLEDAKALWPCPAGEKTANSCGASGCVEGQGSSNPLCLNLSAENPCCCPKNGCNVLPLFNWIIGVCRGHGCACGSSTAKSCAPQNRTNQCSDQCTGPVVACCFGNDVSDLVPYYNEGTHAKINYIASYQFNVATNQWDIDPESSFNTDRKFEVYDLMKPYGGLPPSDAWLAPQPGGSGYWSLGYYPAGVKGVGIPGTMFIMSTEDWFGGTWYMLNQLALDRGPAAGYPSDKCPGGVNDNCWASGNSGEMDFLEPGWNNPKTAAMNYTQSFSTQNNQVGRCFVGGDDSGGFSSKNYLLTEPSPLAHAPPQPIIYVAIVDKIGNWVYRIPATRASEIWPGIGRKGANRSVQAAPTTLVGSVNPGITDYAMTFTPNCQATNYSAARAQNCIFNGQQGFCGNWFAEYADTRQPLFPSQTCVREVRGGMTMPWCNCMVNGKDC